MIARLFLALFAFEQPPMDYCPQHGGWYPPSHFPCH